MKLSTVGLAAVAAGAVGLGALAVPAGAGAEPTLPEVSAEDLVASVLAARPPALGGTVEVHNALGLPALPGFAERPNPLAEPVTTFRVWSDGDGRGRLALPSHGGEQVLVEDGGTLWRYDSASRTATALDHGGVGAPERAPVADPAQAARELVGAVRQSSEVAVDGTAEVAGRAAYELVLTPDPAERTVLREVRVAIDSVTRMPLRLTVLSDGSPDPALQVGFSDLQVGAQDPALFEFTPPEGVTVERPDHPQAPPGRHREAGHTIRTEGDGWDTVVLGQLPAAVPEKAPTDRSEGRTGPLALAQQIGRPVSGPWGSGWVVRTAVGTVLVAEDGRVAAGAVPQQVLAEALTR